MKKTLFLTIILFTTISFAQEEKKEPPQKQWLPSGVLGLNLSQIALENWTQGGEDALAFTFYSHMGLDYHSKPWSFTNKLKAAYGRTKLGADDFRTTDNEFFLEDLLTYHAGWFADPYFSNTVRTTITKGYEYKDGNAIQIADFFDPGYINQSIGLAYKVTDNFTTRLGLGFQETIADKFAAKYSDDADTKDEVETFRFDTGIESVSNLILKLDDDLLYTSELRLFGTFDQLDVWDVRWDNILTAQVTKLINVNLNILLIYDVDQIAKTQLKEALQLGITYTIF